MDVNKVLSELRAERENLIQAIVSLERLASVSKRRRGRPPEWLREAEGKAKPGPRKVNPEA